VFTPNFRGGEITAVMGGCALDLRNSSIQDEAVVTVFAFWGGVTLKVPPDWTVVLNGTPIMGGFEEKTIAPPDNSKRLIIRGYAIMGGVEVRN
jgi:predicted membrane protein